MSGGGGVRGGQRGDPEGRPRQGAGGEVACGERRTESAAPTPPGPRERPRWWMQAERVGAANARGEQNQLPRCKCTRSEPWQFFLGDSVSRSQILFCFALL